MKTLKDKQTSMGDAVRKYCPDGSTFAISGMGAREPFAALFEIIRQGKKDLTFVSNGVSDAGCLILGSGCVKKFEGGYAGIILVGSDNNVRRAREKGIPIKLELEEYTNYTSGLRFLAGSMKLPYMPTKSLLGSDIIKYNPRIKVVDDPYGSGPLALVPASNPDVSFMHVQRADVSGNGQIFNAMIDDNTIARASKHVVLICEEIVSTGEIRKNSHMTAIPSYCVDAVVHAPFAGYPLWCAGYYCCDMPWRSYYARVSKTQEGYEQYIKEWVLDTISWDGFLDKVGRDRLERLVKMERDNYTIPVL